MSIGLVLGGLAAAPALADWVATPVETPAKVTEIRQVDDAVYAWAGDRWFSLSTCEGRTVCLMPGQPPEREAAPDGVPGGAIATADGEGITSAWYSQPTDRYAHGALGDAVEAGAMVVQDVYGHRVTVTLPPDQVFEDLTPRIADFDGEGRNEVLAIRATARAGAALVVYDLAGSSLIEIDSTPPVGANHWLNIAGIGDFTGDRSLDIAAVRRPDGDGTLEIVTLDRRRFRTVDSEKGFSNHVFGSTETGMSAVARINDDNIADLAVPDQDRRVLRIMTVAGGSLREIARVALDGVIVTAIGTLHPLDKPTFLLGLDDGRLIAISEVQPKKKIGGRCPPRRQGDTQDEDIFRRSRWRRRPSPGAAPHYDSHDIVGSVALSKRRQAEGNGRRSCDGRCVRRRRADQHVRRRAPGGHLPPAHRCTQLISNWALVEPPTAIHP